MSLKIRLSRGGAKKRPFYRVVIADARSPRDGRFIEKVGTYNPMLDREHENRVVLNTERIQYWLGQGAQPTDRVQRLLAARDLMTAPVVRDQTKKDKPKAKALERLAEKEEKRKAAEDAADEPAATEPAAEDPAAEESAAE